MKGRTRKTKDELSGFKGSNDMMHIFLFSFWSTLNTEGACAIVRLCVYTIFCWPHEAHVHV